MKSEERREKRKQDEKKERERIGEMERIPRQRRGQCGEMNTCCSHDQVSNFIYNSQPSLAIVKN